MSPAGQDRAFALRWRHLLAMIALAILAAALTAFSSSSSQGSRRWRQHESLRLGLRLGIPPGWKVARHTLVPSPRGAGEREVLALGSFQPRPGTGSRCDGEPTVALRQMRAGDALIVVSEIPLRPRIRARTRGYFPPGPHRYDFSHIMWSPQQRTGRPAQVPLHFSASGRDFTATVYVKGSPAPRLLQRISSTLAGIHFRARAARPLAPASPDAGPCRCDHSIATKS